MPKMQINPIFKFGDIVYAISDPYQFKGIVISLIVQPNGLMYEVNFNGCISSHYAFELSLEKSAIELPKDDED